MRKRKQKRFFSPHSSQRSLEERAAAILQDVERWRQEWLLPRLEERQKRKEKRG